MTAPDPHASLADIEMLSAALGHVFAPWVQDLDLRVLEARAGEVTLALPITRRHVDDTGLLSSQTMSAACETALVLAVMTQLGGFKPMCTVQMQASHLRPVSGGGGAARVVARVLGRSRSLVFGEMQVISADDELACHATATCTLL